MSDLIYRQAAIDAICKACSMEEDYHKCDGYPETSTWCDELVALRALPSAQPERKKGKWKGYNTEEPHKWLRSDGTPIFLICSECCGTVMNNGSAHWNYCPNCGADMRGDNNG